MVIKHTPRQAPYPGIVGQHKMDSIYFFYGLFILFLRGRETETETETDKQTDRIWACGEVEQIWEKLGEEKIRPKYIV